MSVSHPERKRVRGGLTFELEGKVVGQVAALVIAPQEEERVGVPHLERPEVQDALVISSADPPAPLGRP